MNAQLKMKIRKKRLALLVEPCDNDFIDSEIANDAEQKIGLVLGFRMALGDLHDSFFHPSRNRKVK